MKNILIPMVKAVHWHPMLPDIIGGDIAHRYMAINEVNGKYYSRSQDGIRLLKAPETFEAILNFYEQAHGSQIKTLLRKGVEIIVDFKQQRLTLANGDSELIDSTNNTPFTWSMDRDNYFENKASTFLALHWLKNNTVDNNNVMEVAVGGDVDMRSSGKCDKIVSNVLDFNQWREKVVKLT